MQIGRHDVIKLRYPKSEKIETGLFLQAICVKFHQNRPSRLHCRAVTQVTQTETDRHADRQPRSIFTYLVISD